MSQLSDTSIHKLCQPTKFLGYLKQTPMISPYVATKVVNSSGRSYGLSSCTYDVRIARDLTLGTIQGRLLSLLDPVKFGGAPVEPYFALANTLENFNMPHDVCGYVVDKSTFARVFVSAFNTLIDPGFNGNLTLELVNLGSEPVHYLEGDPVCQIAFHWIDRKVAVPYFGKYSGQENRPVGARIEHYDGSYVESDYGKVVDKKA